LAVIRDHQTRSWDARVFSISWWGVARHANLKCIPTAVQCSAAQCCQAMSSSTCTLHAAALGCRYQQALRPSFGQLPAGNSKPRRAHFDCVNPSLGLTRVDALVRETTSNQRVADGHAEHLNRSRTNLWGLFGRQRHNLEDYIAALV